MTIRATPYEQRDLEVLGLRLRFIDVAASLPNASGLPLLLIHGHTSRIEEYDEMIPFLARHHRVLVCDLPGCGYSDKPHTQRYTLRFYEDVLLAFLDKLNIRTTFLAGGSLGGNLVLRLGHRVPDRFGRLVAWAPAGAWPPAKWLGHIMRLSINRWFFWPTVWAQSQFWYARSWPGRRQALADTFTYYRDISCRGFYRMYWDVAADQISQSHFGYAHEISQPTLLVWGDQDHGLNMGQGVRKLNELIPKARLQVFEGAGHSLATEIPEDLAKVTNDFLLAQKPTDKFTTVDCAR